MDVDPESLRQAAGKINKVADDVDNWCRLGGNAAAAHLTGLAAASLLDSADNASRQAKAVLQARMREISLVLSISATEYSDTDTDIAARLSQLGDLNSGDPHAGVQR
ncbi:type VII secretion target [Nocardia nova]|uniref:type VII secretion target n=1 Tax=Nocardia nova TaxID=37330 RepID=UPI0037A33B48